MQEMEKTMKTLTQDSLMCVKDTTRGHRLSEDRLMQATSLTQSLHRGVRAIVLVVCSVVTASAQVLQTNPIVGPGASAISSCLVQNPDLLQNVDTSIPKYWPLPNQVISIADKRCTGGSCSLQEIGRAH